MKTTVKRRLPEEGERVRVRMNLNKNLIAVKAASGEDYGKLLFMTDGPVKVSNPEFRVMDGSYDKVVENGSRDLCAYVIGEYVGEAEETPEDPNVFYNPFRQKHFHFKDSTPVKGEVQGRLLFWESGGKGRMRLEKKHGCIS